MSPTDIAHLSDEEIVEFLVKLPTGEGAQALASDAAHAAFLELRRRYAQHTDVPRSPSGRIRSANSVELDPQRWRLAWYRRRLTMRAVSELAGKCSGWANVIARKGCANYYVLDSIAAELGEVTDDLIYEVASDRERLRMSFA
jgi:hypothetical protein